MKTTQLFLLVCLMMVLAVPDAGAQFWKKKEKKPVRKRPPVTQPKPAQKIVKKPKVLDYPPSKIRARYRVDVLAALYLDELVKDDKADFKNRLPEQAAPGYYFYEGIKLAADTLNNLGYNIDVHIHDITQQGLSPENLIRHKTLLGSDLIIGLVQSEKIPALAEYARKSKINFVSALSPSDADVRNNPFFTIVQPTLRTHCEQIRKKAMELHPTASLIMIGNTGNSTDSAAFRYTREGQEKKLKQLYWGVTADRNTLEKLLDTGKTNAVIIPVISTDVADSILQQLSDWFPDHRFAIFGMPSWPGVASIRKQNAFPNMSVMYTAAFNFDNTAPAIQALNAHYKSEFGGKPVEMVYRGYEILYWSAYLLQKYGTVFNNRLSDTGGAAFTRFDIKPQWTAENDLLYLENEHVYFYRYQAGSYSIEQ